MNYVVTPRISTVLEGRRDKIAGDLEKAKEADADAKAMQANYEQALASARADEKAEATKAANEKAAKAEADGKLAKKLATAEELAEMRDEAMANLNDVATEGTRDSQTAYRWKATKAEVTSKWQRESGERLKTGDLEIWRLKRSTFVAIGFTFLILVWRKAGSAIGGMLDERTKKIEAELAEAQALREEEAAELQVPAPAREAADEAKTI